MENNKKDNYPILNPSNIEITETDIKNILSKCGINIPITDIDL